MGVVRVLICDGVCCLVLDEVYFGRGRWRVLGEVQILFRGICIGV